MNKLKTRVIKTAAMCFTGILITSVMCSRYASSSVSCSNQGKIMGQKEFDPSGQYHAYIGIQQEKTWIFRDAWYNPSTGKNGELIPNGSSYKHLHQSQNQKIYKIKGKIQDTVICGNGTYSVKITGLNKALRTVEKECFSMLYVSTNIPASAMETLKISNIKVFIDGKKVWSKEPYINEDAREWGLYQFDIINHWQKDIYKSPALCNPKQSVKIVFKVSGMDYSKE